ncbi:hypothetical protein HUT19_41045 [Streptomyces sp. NA02950]|uniref:hypothetical protein n=1 Tax=Streptomyces sp. NA02950 TaxID=2742137 RepID=UPI00159137EB|nr:hypothetical protein [Streptomyces sp. NA02950]QKV90397.1 hypothetical protein HUT19_00175 [Streptomyces sp. NA02950]QKV97270.1 hypothetical protein HUT19_41045 [Streptomyces sp. NA02950]
MRRFDRGTLRAAGFVALATSVFLIVNTSVAAAADGRGEDGGGLLAPLNVTTSEGAPLNRYELGADGGKVTNVGGQIRTLMLGGLFTLVRLLVGLSCWLIKTAFDFPLLKLLIKPAQEVADEYNKVVVDALGLKGLLLSWAFVFGLILFQRGKVGRGLGEIVLTLLIAAIAASSLIRPDVLLGKDGPLEQTHQAAMEVSQITVDSHWGKGTGDDPCDMIVGPLQDTCDDTDVHASSVSQPMTDVLTDVLVVKPYQLLQYGRILHPKDPDEKEAYQAHLKWVRGKEYDTAAKRAEREKICKAEPALTGRSLEYCLRGESRRKATLHEIGDTIKLKFDPLSALNPSETDFDDFMDDMKDAGKTGEAAAAYAENPTWDRVGAVALLLIAVILIAALASTMALVLLGAQGADVGAAAVGGVALVWGMLPGPNRMVVWRWMSIFFVSVLLMFATAGFLPAFGIAVDTVLMNGPDLMVERLLLVDALALAGLAFHRRLLRGANEFGSRMAMRMRYAKVGGTHLPGDTSEIGAALAMHGAGSIGRAPGLLPFGGGSPAHSALGMRHKVLNNLAALTDGTGMPVDSGQLLGDAAAEARRGLAPGLIAGRLGAGAAYGLLIGRRPDDVKLDRWRKPTAASGSSGDDGADGADGGEGTSSGRTGGARMVADSRTGEVLYDPQDGRTLLGARVHNRMVRFRGYRIARRAGRLGYYSTYGLPTAASRGRGRATRAAQDARTQLRVYRNRGREEAARWVTGADAVHRAGQRTAAAVTHAGQRTATAARVYGPPAAAAVRRGVRNTATAAVLATSPDRPHSHIGSSRPAASSSAGVDPRREARRRILDSLMEAQRATWERRPRWGARGGEGGEDS